MGLAHHAVGVVVVRSSRITPTEEGGIHVAVRSYVFGLYFIQQTAGLFLHGLNQ